MQCQGSNHPRWWRYQDTRYLKLMEWWLSYLCLALFHRSSGKASGRHHHSHDHYPKRSGHSAHPLLAHVHASHPAAVASNSWIMCESWSCPPISRVHFGPLGPSRWAQGPFNKFGCLEAGQLGCQGLQVFPSCCTRSVISDRSGTHRQEW